MQTSTRSTKDRRIGLSRLKLLSSRRYDGCREVDWEHIDSTFRDISLLRDDNNTDTYIVDVNQHKPVVRNDDVDSDACDNVDDYIGSDNIHLNDKEDDNDPHYGNMEDNHSIRSRDGVIADDSDISTTNIPSIPFVLSIQYNNNDKSISSSSRSLQIQSTIESFLKDNYVKEMSTIRNSTATNNGDNDNDNDNIIKENDNNNIHNRNDITSYVECSHCNSMEIIHTKKLTELSSWRRSMMSHVKKQS